MISEDRWAMIVDKAAGSASFEDALAWALAPADAQSYVDIFLAGCLEIEEKYHLKNFAASCVNTTGDWSLHWVNDRIYPRRPTVYQAKALVIDALLQQQIPTLFNRIQLTANS